LIKMIIADYFLFPLSSYRDQICHSFFNHGIYMNPEDPAVCNNQTLFGKIINPQEGSLAPLSLPIKAIIFPPSQAQSVNYRLQLGEGLYPESWLDIAEGTTTGYEAIPLTQLDLSQRRMGFYTLKLMMEDNLANKGETRRSFRLSDYAVMEVDTFNTGWNSSLHLDSLDKPHIGYSDYIGPVKYAFYDGRDWKK